MIASVSKSTTSLTIKNPTKNRNESPRNYFHKTHHEDKIHSSFQSQFMREIPFKCLNNRTIFEAKISDHLPVIHHGMLFWNVMMQCRFNEKGGYYNNGFGAIESEQQYENRLYKIAQVVAEIVEIGIGIDRIGFCEGPIGTKTESFYNFLISHHSLSNFVSETGKFSRVNPYLDNKSQDWGVLLLAHKKYSVEDLPESRELCIDFPKLEARFGIFKLTVSTSKEVKYVALGHLPLGNDDEVVQQQSLSPSSYKYRLLINKILDNFSGKDLSLGCDFNFNPYFIGYSMVAHYGDKIPSRNNIKYLNKIEQRLTTVDGILLSCLAKQKIHYDKIQWPIAQVEEKKDDTH